MTDINGTLAVSKMWNGAIVIADRAGSGTVHAVLEECDEDFARRIVDTFNERSALVAALADARKRLRGAGMLGADEEAA